MRGKVLLAVVAGVGPAAARDAPPSLGWMVGSWCTAPHRAVPEVRCERWEAGAGGVMRGAGERRQGGQVVPTERMTIRPDGGGYLLRAEPRGQAPADFRAGADDVAELAVTFVRTGDDHPQRIRYWRDREMLMAEAAMADDGRAISWRFLPAK